MALLPLEPFPKRNIQGSKLTSYQHDDIHEQLRQGYNAIIGVLNSGGGGIGSGLPVGSIIPWFVPSVPSGNFMWVENITYNKIVYDQLFSVYGTMYNTGGEGPNDFRLPPVYNRYIRGVNINGDIGSLFGANSQNITPEGLIEVDVTNGSLIGSLNVTQGLSGSISNGTLASNVIVDIGTLNTNVVVNNNPLTGDINITNNPLSGAGVENVQGVSCSNLPDGEPGAQQYIQCNVLTIDVSGLASKLTTNVAGTKGTLATDVTVNQGLTGSLNVTQGLIGSISNGTLATNVSVGNGTLASDVSATASFTGDQFTVNIVPLSIGARYIIKFAA